MPTALTASVQEGKITNLKDFVWTCARHQLLMRDDAPIPERFEPTTDHPQKINDANTRITWLNTLTPQQRQEEAERAYDTEIEVRKERARRQRLHRARYEAMLDAVRAWEPPTEEHAALKRLMEDQLVRSIDFDCNDRPARFPQPMTGDEWYTHELERAARDLAFHTKAHREQVERLESRNAWIAALRESVGAPTQVESSAV